MTKIFITDYIETPDIEQEVFGKEVEIICLNEEQEENFPESISEADAVLVWHAKITELTIKRLKKCKAIVRYGVGYDNVEFQCAREYGIPFANTPAYGVHEVADTAISLILTLVRKVSNYN
ncbi:MAG: C-terminal binding protein, partial [Bacteroidetes bacterium]|nr:C-terminal binding protein [Bacteroidota bacterium]